MQRRVVAVVHAPAGTASTACPRVTDAVVARRSSGVLAQAELDLAQGEVTSFGWLQAADDVHRAAVVVADDDDDRLGCVGDAAGGCAAAAHELGELGAQVVVERLVEADAHAAALALGEAEPVVEADRDLHGSADEPSRSICASRRPAPLATVRFGGVDSLEHDGANVRLLRRTRAGQVLDRCWTAPT